MALGFMNSNKEMLGASLLHCMQGTAQLTLSLFQDLISNSPYYLQYNSSYVSSENLVLDQLIIP